MEKGAGGARLSKPQSHHHSTWSTSSESLLQDNQSSSMLHTSSLSSSLPPAAAAEIGGMPIGPKALEAFPDLHYKMCKKIAQLTKVIHQLNTKNEDHQVSQSISSISCSTSLG